MFLLDNCPFGYRIIDEIKDRYRAVKIVRTK